MMFIKALCLGPKKKCPKMVICPKIVESLNNSSYIFLCFPLFKKHLINLLISVTRGNIFFSFFFFNYSSVLNFQPVFLCLVLSLVSFSF